MNHFFVYDYASDKLCFEKAFSCLLHELHIVDVCDHLVSTFFSLSA